MRSLTLPRPWLLFTVLLTLLFSSIPTLAPQPAFADHTADPAGVALVGSLQDELGCPGDWQPDCAATELTYDAADDLWQATFDLPAGAWEYKVALNDAWDENYGAGAEPNGPNIALNLAAPTTVKFYYSHHSHWITDNVNVKIVSAPGDYQSAIGCPGDWQPDCLRSWLQDIDGDGIYTFETTALPAGSYQAKIAIGESWDENYGAGGVPGGDNIAFTVAATGDKVTFRYNRADNSVSIRAGVPPEIAALIPANEVVPVKP